MRVVRKGLSIDELGDLLERPFNATLATYRRDGSVLLSPVWHEWREGGMVVIRLVPGRLRTWDFADDYALAGSLTEQ
jgi:hypothetical protein